MIEKLDQENFNTLKGLAEVQANLSLGRAELLKLKETTEEYMVVREKEAEERVIKVFKESSDALEQTSKNHNELSRYASDLKAYADELKSIAIAITTLFKDFNDRMTVADEDMKVNENIVSDILKSIKIERVQVEEDRKMLDRERQEIRDSLRLLNDRRRLLERGFEELKKLKDKKI